MFISPTFSECRDVHSAYLLWVWGCSFHLPSLSVGMFIPPIFSECRDVQWAPLSLSLRWWMAGLGQSQVGLIYQLYKCTYITHFSPLTLLLIQSRVKSLFPMSNVNAYDRAMMFFLVKNTNFCILVQVFLQVFFVPNFLFKIPEYTNCLQSLDLLLVAWIGS